MLSAICFTPSQNAIEPPIDTGYKNPTVHSNTWCNGKNDKNLSSSVKSNLWIISITFVTKFLCDNITAFDIAVVPDVNNIIPILSASILASKYCLFPSSNNFLPFSCNAFCE